MPQIVRIFRKGLQMDFAIFHAGQSAEGQAASSAQGVEEIAFGGDAAGGFFVVKGLQNRPRGGVVCAAFDGDGALTRCGQDFPNGRPMQPGGDDVMTEAVEAGFGQEESVHSGIFRQFAQTGWHVAADFHHLKIRSQMQELGFAARTRCRDRGSGPKGLPATGHFGDEDIRGVGPFEDGCKDEAGRLSGRQIFQAVDGGINLPGKQRLCEFLGEEAFLQHARRGKAHIETLIAGGFDDPRFKVQSGVRATEFFRDDAGLGKGEIAAPRAEKKAAHERNP